MCKKTKIFLKSVNKISFLTLSVVCALFFLIVSCRNPTSLLDNLDNTEEAIEEKPVIEYPATYLAGTVWKLSGYFNRGYDVATGGNKEGFTEKVLEPLDCDDCYTITFWGDSIFYYKSISAYGHKNLLKMEEELDPYITGNYGNGSEYFFRYGIDFAKSYELINNELKLFFNYQDKNYYLLFKLIFV